MFIVPGALVNHPLQPAWGVGQVQSVIGNRATVNFEHAGKVVINTDRVTLDIFDGVAPDGKSGQTDNG
ncbi:DUF3553 domain-containing protein [Abyssibius alkaniclasticus]|uniref:DUF3553 domain-containing protein n=1 Tax=Abyssibius alkaniclasticus TaxID=2881234 RepID=UPI002364845D|nr:DUF3553 domain-containing protein [Abyssibius alkaniclasticus]UPH70790.1 DUF3553 domain-containing protein [Abyssibius alkaniclasticus]|tara:strand:- start:412 stop:615 length:204 start_codon:yes stop_codon:yes gene_type:complete